MGDASLIEMIVVKVSPYLREDRPLLWLSEKDADRPRLLPIAIGEFEAAAIQMPLEGEDPIRPISYDLLFSMLDRLTVKVRQIVIHAVRKSVYYARIVIEKGHRIEDIDSRPSDAIALALRAGAPIFVSQDLLDQVGLEPLEDEFDFEHTLDRFYEFEPQVSAKPQPRDRVPVRIGPELDSGTQNVAQEIDELSLLQSRLQQAVLCEEYEEAARLRDEIESLVNRGKS